MRQNAWADPGRETAPQIQMRGLDPPSSAPADNGLPEAIQSCFDHITTQLASEHIILRSIAS